MLLDANVALLDLLEFPSLRLWPLLRSLTECSSVRFLFIVLCVITVIFLIYFRLSPIIRSTKGWYTSAVYESSRTRVIILPGLVTGHRAKKPYP
jgi:hypothetical protein